MAGPYFSSKTSDAVSTASNCCRSHRLCGTFIMVMKSAPVYGVSTYIPHRPILRAVGWWDITEGHIECLDPACGGGFGGYVETTYALIKSKINTNLLQISAEDDIGVTNWTRLASPKDKSAGRPVKRVLIRPSPLSCAISGPRGLRG